MVPVTQKNLGDSLPIDMLLSAVPVLVVALPSLEIPEGLTNYPVSLTVQRKISLGIALQNSLPVCIPDTLSFILSFTSFSSDIHD
jgi:hypothetical protein